MFFKALGLGMAGLAALIATGSMGDMPPEAALMPATIAMAAMALGMFE